MGSKCRRKKKLRKNRGGERLQEWRILKSFNCLPTNANEGTNSATASSPGSPQPKNEIPLQELVIEALSEDDCYEHEVVEGRRIIDIGFLFEKLKELNNHAPKFCCSFSNLILTREITRGLRSGFIFVCNMCGFKETVWSDPSNESSLDINAAAVAGSMSTGGGFANLTKFLGAMNVRCMGFNTYEKYKHIVSKGWEDSALAEMKVAAEEAALARERNDVDKDGVPLLTVVADGSWSKRSYRTNFNSLSGVITQRQIGFLVLWTPLGVRIEQVVRDESFWETNMVSRLERFYFNCLLPEIIDPRTRRNMAIREPMYILEAKREKMYRQEKKLKKCQSENQ